MHGGFCWYELLTTDPAAAEEFYGRVTGWTVNRLEVQGEPYRLLQQQDLPVAGMMQLPADAVEAGARPHWLLYVAVEDVAATAGRAAEAGARVLVGPREIPGIGPFAVLCDPQGALFALHAPENPPPACSDQPPQGHFCWAELATSDGESAFGFYSALFGWSVREEMDLGPSGKYRMFAPPEGRILGGIYTGEGQAPPNWLLYVTVADLEKSLEAVVSGGGAVIQPPHEIPGGDRVARLKDPQGAVLGLHEKAAGR